MIGCLTANGSPCVRLQERAAILRRTADAMMSHQADLALILALECGKPLAEAKGEIAYGASFFTWFAEEARRMRGATLPVFDKRKRCGRGRVRPRDKR